MNRDFEMLLQHLEKHHKIQKPYLLVGHSLGGTLIQLYAHRYPDNVKGIVLVDAAHEDLPPHESYPPHQPFPSEKIIPKSTLRAIFPNAIHGLSVLAEMQAIIRNDKYIRDYIQHEIQENKKYLYDIPLTVISRGQYPEKQRRELTEKQKLIERLQAQLATRSTNVSHIICEPGTGHYIHHQRPEVVANAIRDLAQSSS